MARQNAESAASSNSNSNFPPIPPLGSLRVATPLDVMRMGIITYAAFEKTMQFTWMIPDHRRWPSKALQLERQRLASIMRSRNYVVVVAEDVYDSDEAAKATVTIPSGDRVPNPASHWTEGQFEAQQQAGLFPRFSRIRPLLPSHEGHQDEYEDVLVEMKEKHFVSCGMTLETLVVHPAYAGRDHGRRLLEWGRALADMDGVAIGVAASDISLEFYLKYHYQLLETLRLRGDAISPAGLTTYIMKYVPAAN
ncbi:hypothetical protein LTR70_004797 [Exophiala xenobiotica]|uniref:N-acetyltransferase domain-containing protein n=1 Tax=Lithohypha guttulata TaxID=1690604 RepID=A0ABR0KCE8_9EURO|nr:hypothetical protein LTR24_004289 [Lithohypha guttulata]KAK5319887.1 hypothetical protein LTR70_004797 [Exophiala xenobiotica]